jgi:hypothetical protein
MNKDSCPFCGKLTEAGVSEDTYRWCLPDDDKAGHYYSIHKDIFPQKEYFRVTSGKDFLIAIKEGDLTTYMRTNSEIGVTVIYVAKTGHTIDQIRAKFEAIGKMNILK